MVHAAQSFHRQAVCVVAILIAFGGDVRASDARAMGLLRTWISAVQTHTPGEADGAAHAIAAWSQADIDWVRPYLQTLVELSVEKDKLSRRLARMDGDLKEIRALAKQVRAPESPGEFAKRAALLHSDIVMLIGWDPARVWAPTANVMRALSSGDGGSPTVRVLGPDGRFEGYQLANPHWEIAREALAAIPPDEDVRRWYHVVASYFAKFYAFADLAEQLQAALLRAPDDPWLLYDSGCHQEALASPMIQDFVHQTTLPQGRSFKGMTTPSGHWQRAETLFRRALATKPEFPEAQLRLGRVLGLRERPVEAITELDRVDANSTSPSVKYFASLFRGDAERALGHQDRARTNYETAVALYPQSQAGRMALGHLLREAGDRAGAMTTLEPALSAPASRTSQDDPWWDYHRCEGPFIEHLYGELVTPFLKDRAQ